MRASHILGAIIILAVASSAVCAQQLPAVIPANCPNPPKQALQTQRSLLVAELEKLKTDVIDHNKMCDQVKKGTPQAEICQTELLVLQDKIGDYMTRRKAFDAAVAWAMAQAGGATTLPTNTVNAAAARILAGIQKIQVPPPIPPEDATVEFGQLVPDEKSAKIILGTEVGVAIADVAMKLAGKAMPPAAIILATGKTLIAQENAADVYLVKKDATYETALKYLRSESEHPKFIELLRDLREKKPVPKDANEAMVRAAKAILDPQLGNSGLHMAWDAMWSPDARHAALTQATIELGGYFVGKASEGAVNRIFAAQQPAFKEASASLAEARMAMAEAKDPQTINSLFIAIQLANDKMAASYRADAAVDATVEHLSHLLFTRALEKAVEKNDAGGKPPSP